MTEKEFLAATRAINTPMVRRMAEAEFLKLARERFAQAEEAEKAQRQRELEDLRFYAGDQWPSEIRAARAGHPASSGLPSVPARPCLTINKVREPIHQVLNGERQADMNIELVAADDFGELQQPLNDTEIKLREGLIRRIQRNSQASDARTWAFTRATIAGRGFYGVMTRFLDGKTWDQEIYIHRYYNQASVTLDPAHEQPDGSDAEWAFVGTDMPWAQYQAEFPRAAEHVNRLIHADDMEFRALGESYPGWFTSEGETRSARVVEYWYTERISRTLVRLSDGSIWWEDELPDEITVSIEDTRDVVTKQIKWAKLDGTQILEETDWPGPDLPIVKVLGEELQPYDKERRVEGMVRPSRDAAQGFNAMVSKWVETVGYAPLPPWQYAEGQIEGYEAWYQASTTRAIFGLPYKTSDLEGRPVGPPTRTPVITPIEAIAASVQMFDQAIKSTTGVPDPNLGRQDPSVTSGKMALALIAQSQHGTSNYLDNYQRSIRYEGQIINNLLYPIYGQPGRLVRIMTGEGDSQTIRIGPSLQPAGGNGGPPTLLGGRGGAALQPYTLTPNANFNVAVKTTRAFTSRREEETSILGELLSANPMFMGWFGDLFFKNQDGPGHDEMAERAKVMLDPKIQAMLAQQTQGQAIPPAAMAQLSMLQAKLQQAESVIQQAQNEIRGKQTEQQAKIYLAELDAQLQERLSTADRESKAALELELARIRAESVIAVAEINKRQDVFSAERDRIGVPDSQIAKQAHEAALQAADHAHTERLAQRNVFAPGSVIDGDQLPTGMMEGTNEEPQTSG